MKPEFSIKTIAPDHFEEMADICRPEHEKCVLCGAETPYLKSTPTDLRENYIDGAGQLCQKCTDSINKNQN